ncbi:unnamed protein product, partial [Closterium sp. Naga37s-1]
SAWGSGRGDRGGEDGEHRAHSRPSRRALAPPTLLGYPHPLRAVLPCPQPPRALRVTHGCFRFVLSSVARAAPSPPPPDVASSAGLRERGDSAGGGRRWLKQGGERGGAGGNVRLRRGGERGRVVLKRGCTVAARRGIPLQAASIDHVVTLP